MDTPKVISLPTSEWQRYKELRLDALQNDSESFYATYEYESKQPGTFWKKRLKDRTIVFAEVDGVVASMAGANYEDNDDGIPTAFIVSVYTRPKYRKQGLSQLVLEELIKKIRETDSVHRIELNVNKDATGAVRLYEKLGFKKGKPIPDFMRMDGKYFANYLMCMDLG